MESSYLASILCTSSIIDNEVIAELWGYGITETYKVYDAEGLALYFKAYLRDIEYSDEAIVDRESVCTSN